MTTFDMPYNSQSGEIVISEYGRNIQKLIYHARGIEDKEERTAYVYEMVNLLGIMKPKNRGLADAKNKLWNHLMKIANYDLDIDIPEDVEIVKPDTTKAKPEIYYPQSEYRFRHYGHYIQDMIAKAVVMEDLEMRKAYSATIASYMKLAYHTWNKEHYVNDEIIKNDLEKMSKGVLTFEEEYSIENLVQIPKHNRNHRGRNNNNRNRNNNNRNRNNNNRNRNNNKRR